MYKTMCTQLDTYIEKELDEVRAKAAAGNGAAVAEFASKVGADLAEEASEWRILQAVLSEMIPRRFAPQHGVTP